MHILAVSTFVVVVAGSAACAQSVPGADAADGATDSGGSGDCSAPLSARTRPIYPPSGSVITTRRTVFRWAGGESPATVEVCADRPCSHVLRSMRSASREVASDDDLPSGVVFWRVLSNPCERVAIATWELHVSDRRLETSAAWGAPIDLNGDGFDDLLVLARRPSSGVAFLGGPSGLSTTGTTFARFDVGIPFGSAIQRAGDIDGDGFVDVVMMNEDGVSILFGSPSGLGSRSAQYVPSIVGPGSYPVADGAGDVNGDGYSDLIVGRGDRSPSGAWIYLGGSNGLAASPSVHLGAPPGTPNFGSTVGGLGDVNADGFADVAVGAPPQMSGDGSNLLFLYLGGADGPNTASPIRLASRDAASPGASGRAAGDINGDGFPDFFSEGMPEGSNIYVGASPPSPSPLMRLLRLGALSRGIGDVNHDGFDDVATSLLVTGRLGATLLLGSAAGMSTGWSYEIPESASALSVTGGDYNGDGFPDVAVGLGQLNVVNIYYGGRSGLPATPSLTLRLAGAEGFGVEVAVSSDAPRSSAASGRLHARDLRGAPG